ncbi:hypothetical protein K469DRAFT_750548 [Zopfia rhizophila CBS 207.26]|uniref:Small ribosomal subunit protein mS29 n=1 Tax=Zopfia rhizophila CBS 207.26 TaxID=1314779 RepID=A0A6A6DZP5_9PEZI|nr:hypothetical protein K469DRAFT_750548 [Zopfia rhizophila CBS 207.26]
MPSSTCLRRFSQLSLDNASYAPIASRNLLTTPQASCFSTSRARYANPTARKGMVAPPKRGTKTLNVKKGKSAPGRDTGKRPAPGERKAMRKRIVLSNINALEVRTLKDLDKANVLSKNNEGQVLGLPNEVVDALRAVEAFKTTQGWSLFRRPATLYRKETTEVAELIKQVEEAGEGQKKTIRRVLIGDRMSGKSTLLLQALMMAFMRDWVVVNLPDAKDIVIAHTEYAPLPNSNPTQYTQDAYTAALLSQISKANEAVLQNLPVITNPTLPIALPSKSNLKQLADIGAANPEASWPIFNALWAELTKPGRPPLILAIDNLSHIMRHSAYLSADVKPIHAFDLTLISHFISHLSGQTSLPNGGLVLAATTNSNSPSSPAMEFSLEVAEKKRYGGEVPRWNPYKHVDERVTSVLRDVEVLKVGGLSKEEARCLLEYYAASGMVRGRVDEGYVGEKWSLAGMGNCGELERVAIRMRV